MWNYDQFAHDVFRDQLLNLGFLASRLVVVRFDAAKVAVQKAFLKRSAPILVAHRFRPQHLEADATRLLEWLERRVCRNATRLLTDELRHLFWHCSAAKVGPVYAVERGDAEAFFEQKAKCCALAFIAFRKEVGPDE